MALEHAPNTAKRKQSVTIASEQAKRLATLKHCSVRQAAQAALVLTGLDENEEDQRYQRCCKSILNKAAKETKSFKQTFVEPLKVSKQTYFVSKIPALLQRYCNESQVFAKELQSAIQRHPQHCLSLLLYIDETSAGNVLSPVCARKSHLIYISAVEFEHRLSNEQFWLVAGLVQHDNVEKVSGGLSEIVKELLLHWHSESGGLLDPAGFAITLCGKTMLVRFSLYGMISDEGNIKQTLRSKGAAGMRPCIRCCNIISKYHGTNLDIDAGSNIKDITVSDVHSFVPQKDRDIFEVLEHLHRTHTECSQTEFETQEKIYGWNWSPTGLLANPLARSLLPPSKCYYDFLHVLFSNGICNVEIALFWDAVKRKTGVTLQDLEQFVLSGFQFRGSLSVSRRRMKILVDERLLEKNAYAGDAGQTALLVQLLEVFTWLVLRPLGAIDVYVDSFLLLAEMCRWYWRIKRGKCLHLDKPSLIMIPKISAHLAAFTLAYGRQRVRPKHHFGFHCAEAMDHQKIVLDCWTLERKHRIYKDAARMYAPSDSFESSMLVKLLMVQEQCMKDLKPDPWLFNPSEDQDLANRFGVSAVLVATSMRHKAENISVGDFVISMLRGGISGRVLKCLAIDHGKAFGPECALLIEIFEKVESKQELLKDTWSFSEWKDSRSTGILSMKHAESLLLADCWWNTGSSTMIAC